MGGIITSINLPYIKGGLIVGMLVMWRGHETTKRG